MRHLQQFVGRLLDGVHVVVGFTSLECPQSVLSATLSQHLSTSQTFILQLSTLNRARKKQASLSHTAQKARYSLICSYSPLQEKWQAKKISFSTELGKDDMYNLKLFILSSPMCPNILLLWQCFLFLLASVLCWNFYTENLDFHKELHSYRRKFFSGASKLMLRGPEAYSWPSEMFTDKTLGFYAHCLVHRWVKSLLGLLTYGAGSHKGTFCP